MENQHYFTKKFEEIPNDLLFEAVEYLKMELTNEEKEEIEEAFKESGAIEWAILHHSTWGRDIRNSLRTFGLTDEKLPDGNWDDYYIQVIEFTLGLR